MNESSMNTRTLIVSFVVAIMVLIPLRFIEAGQMIGEQPMVLGEQTEVAAVAPVVETPRVVAVTDCYSPDSAKIINDYNKAKIQRGTLSTVEVDKVITEIVEVEANTCR